MTSPGKKAAQSIQFGGVTPILRVADVKASVEYYVKRLGFKSRFFAPSRELPLFACVARGDCGLFLCSNDQGHPGSWVWIDGKDVEALHEEFKVAGAKIRNPPTNYEWALEMQVEDLDGNILRFGSDPNPNQPIGPWLDMYGDRWVRMPDGKLKKLDPAQPAQSSPTNREAATNIQRKDGERS